MRNLWCWASALALAATSVACSSSSDSGSSGGGRTMNLKGGKGLTYDGGTGGYFDVEGRTGAGGVKVLSAGSVNTDVSLPSRVPYLGTNAQIVSADTTLNVGASGFHLTAGSTTVTNGTGTVTGIWVKPGVTLTINPNYDTNNADVDNNAATGTREQVRFYLSDSLIVDGTIKIGKMDQTAAGEGLGVNTANVYTGYVGAWWISSSGKIDVSGADNVSGPGRNGGYLQAYPDTIYNAGI